jgi:hypothetical protein
VTHAQKVFEAIMSTKGHTDFSKSATGKYNNPSLAMRWPYFLLGWEMREVTA